MFVIIPEVWIISRYDRFQSQGWLLEGMSALMASVALISSRFHRGKFTDQVQVKLGWPIDRSIGDTKRFATDLRHSALVCLSSSKVDSAQSWRFHIVFRRISLGPPIVVVVIIIIKRALSSDTHSLAHTPIR